MGTIRQSTDVAASSNVVLDLSPFDRFGGRGGRLKVQVVAVTADIAPLGVVELTYTVLVGSDVLINAGIPFGKAAGESPDNETPAVMGFGAPADPITITLFNADAGAAHVFVTNVEVENA